MKWGELAKCEGEKLSPPARGRGLKSGMTGPDRAAISVAPCAGAWIEIGCAHVVAAALSGRPLRGGVD